MGILVRKGSQPLGEVDAINFVDAVGVTVRPELGQADVTVLGGLSSARPNRVVVIGDSETSNFSGGPVKIAAQRSAKTLWGGYFATAGLTLQQIHDTHLPTVLALTGWQKPIACAIFGGTNDVGANSGGGVGTGFVFATSKATHLDICTQLVAAGILPLLVMIPPRTDATLANTNVRQWNAYITGLGVQKGWPVLNLHDVITKPTDGSWIASGTADNIHLNGFSNRLVATAAAATLASLFPFGQPGYLTVSVGDTQNLLASFGQLFLGAPTGGIAGNWSGSGTGCVFTVITGDTTIVGNWQTLSRPLAGSANAFLQSNPAITAGFAAGDRLAFSCLYQASGFEANINQTGYIIIECRDAGNVVLSSTLVVGSNASDCAVNAVAYEEFVVPANTTNIRITAGVNGAATTTNGSLIQLAQPSVINLTALGLA